MKRTSTTLTSLAAFVLAMMAGTAQAHDITINWTPMSDPPSFFAPKVASDGIQNTVTIAQTGTGLSSLETQLGQYVEPPGTAPSVNWSRAVNFIYGPSQQSGLNPTIAVGYNGATDQDVAIEVHQGGQEGGSALWYQLGTNPPPFFSGITWNSASQLGPGHRSIGSCAYPCPVPQFDYGYNPTVAADLNGPKLTSTTVVEVHQASTSASTLYYHVGVLTLGSSPSITWGPSLEVSSTFQGSAPVVSIANNVAVLVAQGSGGTLWYSIGVVDTATSTIAWTTPSSYASGYSPTVSVYGNGANLWTPGRVLVEAHQVDSGTGPLVYSVGVLEGSSPTSIDWSVSASGTLNTNLPLATGCSPSLALAFGGATSSSEVSVTETHAATCGGPTKAKSFLGLPVGN